VKFEGHFHGYSDYCSSISGRDPARGCLASEPRRPIPSAEGRQRDIIVLPFNDSAALEKTLEEQGQEIAAVILDRSTTIPAPYSRKTASLGLLRKKTEEKGIVLIFDEILLPASAPGRLHAGGISGHAGSLHPRQGARGGVPLSAFAGRKKVMRDVARKGR